MCTWFTKYISHLYCKSHPLFICDPTLFCQRIQIRVSGGSECPSENITQNWFWVMWPFARLCVREHYQPPDPEKFNHVITNKAPRLNVRLELLGFRSLDPSFLHSFWFKFALVSFQIDWGGWDLGWGAVQGFHFCHRSVLCLPLPLPFLFLFLIETFG